MVRAIRTIIQYWNNSPLIRLKVRGSDFDGAILVKANLQGADLLSAFLEEAVLRGANLKGAKNIAIEQLQGAKTLYQAKLDPELMEQVKKSCPFLLRESI